MCYYPVFVVAPIVCGSLCFCSCFVMQYFVPILVFAIILMGERESLLIYLYFLPDVMGL